MMIECFGINQYEGWTANGRQVYGVRGQGALYSRFWKEFRYKVIWESDNWPWSYFALNEDDEKDFRSKWKDEIGFCERDEDDEPYDSIFDEPPIDPEMAAINLEIATILAEEIQKEIDAHIIKTINMNVREPQKDD